MLILHTNPYARTFMTHHCPTGLNYCNTPPTPQPSSWVYRCYDFRVAVERYTSSISSVYILKVALIHSENRLILVDSLHICDKMTYTDTPVPGG